MERSQNVQKLLASLSDPQVIELMINDDGQSYVEVAGEGMRPALKLEAGEAHEFLRAVAGDAVEASLVKRPYADLLSQDGSRLHVLAAPIVKSLAITIRKKPTRRPALQDLVDNETLTEGCAGLLAYAVENRKNILVAGGTSSGKTTLLNALAALLPNEERILVLEDTPELTLPQPHVMYLRTRHADPNGWADVSLRELVLNTLRMRPDRILVGEVRSSEAWDLLQAMNVGQEGILSTLHASSCREALQRLETLVLMAGSDMPLRALRSNIATALDLVVFMARLADGSRRVMQVAEVTGIEVDNITLADLFKTESRKSPQGATFLLKPTGAMPRFYDGLRQAGLEPPLEFFK